MGREGQSETPTTDGREPESLTSPTPPPRVRGATRRDLGVGTGDESQGQSGVNRDGSGLPWDLTHRHAGCDYLPPPHSWDRTSGPGGSRDTESFGSLRGKEVLPSRPRESGAHDPPPRVP